MRSDADAKSDTTYQCRYMAAMTRAPGGAKGVLVCQSLVCCGLPLDLSLISIDLPNQCHLDGRGAGVILNNTTIDP